MYSESDNDPSTDINVNYISDRDELRDASVLVALMISAEIDSLNVVTLSVVIETYVV